MVWREAGRKTCPNADTGLNDEKRHSPSDFKPNRAMVQVFTACVAMKIAANLRVQPIRINFPITS
jgi:hypothetical protein